MDELRAWYREGLAARIEALEAARAGLDAGGAGADESLRRIAHSLRGSGGTYGYQQITDDAALVEDAEPELLAARLERLLSTLRKVMQSGDDDRITLLLVTGDEDQTRQLRERLGAAGRDIVVAGSAAEAERELVEHEVALVLVDLVLPDMDGRNLLLRLRESPRTAALPVFVLSTLEGAQPKTECFALGADEYFQKPLELETLAASVAAKLQRSAELSRQARHDPLTGLPNRATFNEAYGRAVSLSRRAGEPLSLAFCDLDAFKSVNDTHGHGTGDEVLCRVGAALKSALRTCDLVARWGGEEFVALLPGTDRSGATVAMQRALDVVRGRRFTGRGGVPFGITFSAGVVGVEHGMTVEDAIANADRLLYAAKAAGGNRVLSREPTDAPRRSRLLLAEDDELLARSLQRTLEREGFDVVHRTDGAAALAEIGGGDISLVILDVRMPELGGFEVLEAMRRTPMGARTPVVILTAMGSEEDVVRGFELGADDYVLKPFSTVELIARVRRLLRRAGPRR
jgi:diguanylate cyclase (GGDEF)-like protein